MTPGCGLFGLCVAAILCLAVGLALRGKDGWITRSPTHRTTFGR
jgi:hypothetical protein